MCGPDLRFKNTILEKCVDKERNLFFDFVDLQKYHNKVDQRTSGYTTAVWNTRTDSGSA